MNQDRPSKVCPHCNRGRIYTGDYQQHNGRLSTGEQACADCAVKDIVNQFINRRAE